MSSGRPSSPPSRLALLLHRWFLVAGILAVLAYCASPIEAQKTHHGVLDVEPVSGTVSVVVGRTERLMLQCFLLLNGSDPVSSSSNNSIRVRAVINTDSVGKAFINSDCMSSTEPPRDYNGSLVFPPIELPDASTSNQNSLYRVLATWTFCYRSNRPGQDSVMFGCEADGKKSEIGELNVVIVDPASSGRGIYFGMAPFVFVFAIVLACNLLLWKRLIVRRMALQLALQRQQQAAAAEGQETTIPTAGVTPFSSRAPHGLDPQIIRLIPIHVVTADDHDLLKEMCVICQCEYQVGDEVKRLACKHVYHAACIDSWLGKASSCPICVTEVAVV